MQLCGGKSKSYLSLCDIISLQLNSVIFLLIQKTNSFASILVFVESLKLYHLKQNTYLPKIIIMNLKNSIDLISGKYYRRYITYPYKF